MTGRNTKGERTEGDGRNQQLGSYKSEWGLLKGEGMGEARKQKGGGYLTSKTRGTEARKKHGGGSKQPTKNAGDDANPE